jgi:Domain of unknown function (DUF4350)
MSAPQLFHRRWLLLLGAVTGLSLAVAAVLALDAPAPPTAAPPPGVASRAANGHAVLLAFVRALGIRAQLSGTAVHDRGVLLVLEPDLDPERPGTLARLRRQILEADVVVVVLPKWTGEGDTGHPGWLARAQLLSARSVAAGLTALHLHGSIERPAAVGGLESRMGGGTAALEHPQLVSSKDLVPLVSGPEGILVGEHEEDEQRLVVVSDPDLLSNAGLARGDNARLVGQLLQHLEARSGTLAIDESLQARQPRSMLAGLLHFPSVLAVLQLLVVLALAVWVGAPRFGAPLPEPDPGPHGALALVESAVTLQTLAGKPAVAVRALLESARREVLERLHAPAGLGAADADAWLDARRARGRSPTTAALRNEVLAVRTPRAALGAARRIQRWREGMLDGAR